VPGHTTAPERETNLNPSTAMIGRIFLLTVLLSVPLLGASPRVSAYTIDATFAPAEGTIQASAEIDFALPTRGPVAYYFHGELRTVSIRAGGEEIEFTEEAVVYSRDYSLIARRVSFELPKATGTITVEWKGHFNPSKARSPSDYMRIGSDAVLLRALGYSPWFPIFLTPDEDGDPVAFRRVTIRTPKELTSVFTGELVSRSEEADSQVSVWKGEGIDLFAAQMTARPFVVHRDGDFFAYSMGDARSRAAAEAILAFIRTLDGDYRRRFRADAVAGQIHVMQMPRYGDISSGNVVGLTDGIWFNLPTDANARRGLAHELVHPFVTPAVPRMDPLYAMVVEGFPSYFHLPVLADLGALDYDAYMDWTESSYLEKRATGKGWRGRPLPEHKPISAIKPEEIGFYKDVFLLDDRALLLLDYLRRAMGTETFDRFTADLTRQPELGMARLAETVERFLPGGSADATLWLTTTEFPERFRRSAAAAPPAQ
jgi:hypothetical protein